MEPKWWLRNPINIINLLSKFVCICIDCINFVYYLDVSESNVWKISQAFINLSEPWNCKVGFQASARGGVVKCHLSAGRVALSGPATTTLEGGIYCG